MISMRTIELSAKLVEQAESNARSGGFISLRAYIEHVLEKEFATVKELGAGEQRQNDDIVRKMEEAGYLDEGLDI
jgi:hypothetical protein